ncbi:MAG: ABC transporter ATP-binding protein [Planctomycetota bacterium]
MSDPIIRCERLSKWYGNTHALQHVDLELQPGVTLLVGENGAGKSTLLRIAACLETRSRGSVRVLGLSTQWHPVAIRKRMGFVPQHPTFHDWMTVAECLRFHEEFREHWDRAYAERLREQLRLDSARPIGELSTGKQARLALILALAYRPKLVLLDEPLASLDPSVREDVIELLIEYRSETEANLLISTHQIGQVDALVDHVAFLERGRLLFNVSRKAVQHSIRRLEITFEREAPTGFEVPGLLRLRESGQRWLADVDHYSDELLTRLRQPGIRSIEAHSLDLEQSFIALARRERS